MTTPASPLFDSMVASLQPGSPMRRSHDHSHGQAGHNRSHEHSPAGHNRSHEHGPAGHSGRREVQTALPSISTIVSEPITTKQLTADERDIIAQMGGTVARLLLQMMHDEQPVAR